ncbi:hypothetical protein BLNAU_6313 [Blattamonas nauphoetae]|uniref:Right handed beta helix domain-containing protein n=1 Tax=Blattamonas nauphoetae TaxID=2049346 RepID=A0ABQ9Y4Y9_9EUKA|nr:hypothetical protein BLNAU_6313 [Blattamonas nauphoetae]
MVVNITHSTTITSCSFVKCIAAADVGFGGGLRLDLTDSQATVDRCSFSKCESFRGGGMHCVQFKKLSVLAYNFTDCTSAHIAGALRAFIEPEIVNSEFIVQNSNVTNCSSQSGWGGAMSLTNLVAFSLASLLLTDCTAPAGNGGGIDLSHSNGATLTDVTFKNCSASAGSAGGLVMYNSNSTQKATTLLRVKCVGCSAKDDGGGVCLLIENAVSLVSCQFSDCSAGRRGGGLAVETSTTFSFAIDQATTFASCRSTSLFGDAISLRCPNVSTELNEHSFDRFKQPAGHFIPLADRRLAFGSEVDGVSQHLSYFWYPHSAGADVHVRVDSEDHAQSGRVELTFATIGESFKQLSVNGQKALMDSPLPLSTKVNMLALAVEMKTSSVDDVVTVVDTGQLSLEKGTLTLTSTVTLLGSLSVQGCSFTSFSSSVFGSVISATLTSNTITITSSSFSSCSSDLNGGALSIVFGTGSSSSSLKVDASFSGYSCGVNKLGSAVFVSGSNLENLIVPSQWKTTGLAQPANSTLLWGTDTQFIGKKFGSTSLLVYLVDHSAQVISVETSEEADGKAETKRTTGTDSAHLHIQRQTEQVHSEHMSPTEHDNRTYSDTETEERLSDHVYKGSTSHPTDSPSNSSTTDSRCKPQKRRSRRRCGSQ